MSKASSADTASATTTESIDAETDNDDQSAEPQGTSRSLTVRTDGARDPLYGCDRETARQLAAQANEHEYTEIDEVVLERYEHRLNVRLAGDVCFSYWDARRATGDTYQRSGLISHSSGSVTITLRTA